MPGDASCRGVFGRRVAPLSAFRRRDAPKDIIGRGDSRTLSKKRDVGAVWCGFQTRVSRRESRSIV